MRTILAMTLAAPADALLASRRAREVAGLLDLSADEQTRLGGAVAHVADGALDSGSSATVEVAIEEAPGQRQLAITVTGVEPAALEDAGGADGRRVDLDRVRSLADRAEARADGATARVRLSWDLPDDRFLPAPEDLARALHGGVTSEQIASLDELQRRNRELVRTLATLQTRERELLELNRQLEDTNAGIKGLFAELEQGAERRRRDAETAKRFVRTVSHELRTPLFAARGLLEELAGAPSLDDLSRGDVGLVQQTVEEAIELVNDQLDLLRLQAGRDVVQAEDVHADALLQQLRGTLRVLRRSDAVALVVEAAPDLPPLRTDAGKLAQALRNLVANALKYTDAGEVRVTAATADGDAIAFVVRDTGIGIAPENLDVIFEEYGRVDDAQREGAPSTGLGLPLARSLAELLGGSLTVSSEVGVGSAFTLVVPLRQAEPADA